MTLVSSVYAQSMQELQKMKSEYEQLKTNQIQPQFNEANDIENIDTEARIPRQTTIIPFSIDQDLEQDKILYYGYDFFTKRDTVSFWENLSTPDNYLLGPGDELIISLWGETQQRLSYIINREGTIYDDKVGLLNLSGRTIKDSQDYLKAQFGRIYSTLNGNKPSSFLDVSLGELRSINVNFVGEVSYPGVYPIHPFSNVITGLIQAGGVDTTGSLREVMINRNGEIITKVDFYDFFLLGDSSPSIQLRDQDIIIVPPRLSSIRIDSAIVRPGIYESKSGETIKDIIKYAGGLSYDASDIIGVRQIIPMINRKNGQNFKSFYIKHSNSDDHLINNGDQIIINKMFNEIQEVEIIGQVKKPGTYFYSPNMKLLDLFDLASGYKDSSFWKTIYHSRGELVRRNPTERYETVFEINLTELIKDNPQHNLLLQNLDRFVIHANPNYFEKNNILITGEVNIPGAYPLSSENESLKSLLKKAGGLTNTALENGISIFRDEKYFDFEYNNQNQVEIDKIYSLTGNTNPQDQLDTNNDDIEKESSENSRLRVAWNNTDILLMPGDSIVVREKTNTIFVRGSVYNSGVIEFRKGKSLRYYINAAGGLTELGNKNGIIILYPNGLISPKKWYNNPKVMEGSIIIVNQKVPETPFDITQFATNWTSIISSIITAIILSKQISA